MKQKKHILPVIILSQFACTSLWFAGNSVIESLTLKTGLGSEIMGYVLSSVQFGFIVGTFLFAMLMIADRFSPSKVFVTCAILGALCNASLLLEHLSKWDLLSARFGTGFFLAGIYPVGMKIASDYHEKGLGKALGFLVGALILGTAFPYFIKSFNNTVSYTAVIKITSIMAVSGGILMFLLVPNGPYRKPNTKLQLAAGFSLFKQSGFKKAAFGYFGHMWELYAFWAFTPFAIKTFNQLNNTEINVPLWTGIIIAFGGLSCFLGGILSIRVGSYKVAFYALFISGLLCLASPLAFNTTPILFLCIWCTWGMAVTADSPQFSNLVANAVSPELKGTGLTIVNSIGFAVSILSIELLSFMSPKVPSTLLYLVLFIGPALGIIALKRRS